MVRPQLDLNPYKDEITALFHQQKTVDTICHEISQRYSINLSCRTLARRLQEWGLRRLAPKTVDNEALCERIQSLVRDNLSDAEILRSLHNEGFQIAHDTLKKRRQQLGLRRRTDDPEALRIQEAHMQLVIRQEIQNGKIEGYGRGLLHTHIRQIGHLFPR
jgi:hypothetical protein